MILPFQYFYFIFLIARFGFADELNPQMKYTIGLYEDNRPTILIGSTMSTLPTDKHGDAGRDTIEAWDLFMNWVNRERGGVFINGTQYSMAIRYIEDYSDKNYVRSAYEKMINEPDIDFFFSPLSTPLTWISVPITEDVQRLQIVSWATNESIYKGKTYAFGTLAPSAWYQEVPFYAFSKLGARTFALLADSTYTVSEPLSYEFADKYNIELFGHFRVNPSGGTYVEDIRAMVQLFKDNNVETVYLCSYLDLCVEV
jgi:hypothetical protein